MLTPLFLVALAGILAGIELSPSHSYWDAKLAPKL